MIVYTYVCVYESTGHLMCIGEVGVEREMQMAWTQRRQWGTDGHLPTHHTAYICTMDTHSTHVSIHEYSIGNQSRDNVPSGMLTTSDVDEMEELMPAHVR